MQKICLQCIHSTLGFLEKIPPIFFQCLLACAFFGVLFFSISTLDHIRIPYVQHSDKLNHMMAFFILAGLTKGAMPTKRLGLRWLVLLSYALLIELIQSFLPYRFADTLDFVADVIGILIFEMLLMGLTFLPRSI